MLALKFGNSFLMGETEGGEEEVTELELYAFAEVRIWYGFFLTAVNWI